MARVELPQSSIKLRRRRRRMVYGALAAGAVVLLVALSALLAHASFLRISRVTVVAGSGLASSTVENFIQSQIAGSYALIFPKDNIFLYPKHDIEEGLREKYPLIKDAQVRARDFHSIEATLTLREPAALYCGTEVASGPACFLMDDDGVAYESAPQFSAPIYASYYGPATGGKPAQFLTPGEFRSLFALVDALNKKVASSAVVQVAVDTDSDVRAQFQNGFALIFPLADDGGDVYERFSLALKAEPFASHALSRFEYLDLRFGEKLYYKLKTQ